MWGNVKNCITDSAGLWAGWLGVRVPTDLFTTAFRPALGPIQPPIQCEPGSLPMELRRPGREADHSPPSNAEVNNAWNYTSNPPIRLQGVVSVKSTRTTLPLP